jgi:hypothetical protein
MATADHTRLKQARRVGLELGLAALILAAILFWRDRAPLARAALAGTGAALAILALLRPALIAPAARQWMRLGTAIGRVTSPVFLTIIYLGVIAPVGWLRRRLGTSPLSRDRDARSYWVPRAPRARDAAREAMRRLF